MSRRERQVPISPQHWMLLKFTSGERERIREAAERDGQPMRQWVRAVAVRAAETSGSPQNATWGQSQG